MFARRRMKLFLTHAIRAPLLGHRSEHRPRGPALTIVPESTPISWYVAVSLAIFKMGFGLAGMIGRAIAARSSSPRFADFGGCRTRGSPMS